MSLHVETSGSGAPLVLLHGWGMHGGVWADVAQKLAVDFQVHSVDLPGNGASAALPETNLDALVQVLSVRFGEPLSVCGWSLGGQVALHWAAREPDKVRRLILVASTPCFAEREDWAFGMESAVLEKFAAELEVNHAATLRRFISLQLRGSENERELLMLLRERLFSRGEPDMGALRGGLDILRDADQRAELQCIRQPTLVVAGERDKLTVPAASHYMAQAMPTARMVEVAGAAHAPFLSHAEIFVEHVKRFLHE
ncbi:MAG: pimelyl-acyl-carrier protein methyl ester [Gallionellaceae bacterium]|nr:MAG: pimelyl-acyl-carrier protein methyl ester [Gallionellaceae bacterium]